MTPKLSGLALFSLVLLAGQALAGPTTPPQTTGKSGSVDSGVRTVLGDRAPKVPGRPAVAPLPDGGYRLIWTDVSTDEVGFMVERYPAFPEGPTRLVGANISELIDTQDLSKARYRVRAMGERLHSRWTTWAQGTSMAAGFVSLTPGGGFSGPTPQPPAVGTSEMAGYDAKAIARWDVVPYQTFAGTFHLGVVAFHINGIDRVEFSVNGGPWKAVREMKRNPRTNVWEYTAILKASNFADGPVEVRAIAWPRGAGDARVLSGPLPITGGPGNGEHSMVLFSNSRGSLPAPIQWADVVLGSDSTGDGSENKPYRTIYQAMSAIRAASVGPYFASFGTVYLKPGSYDYSGRPSFGGYDITTPAGWITIAAAPGLARTQVVITSTSDMSDPKSTRTRFYGLTLASNVNTVPGINPAMWFDNCAMIGEGRTCDRPFSFATNVPMGIWMTDCEVRNVRSNLYGCRLQRNVRVYNIGEQGFYNNGIVLNAFIDGIDSSGTSFHPDIIHFEGGPFDNTIVYNLEARNAAAQGVFCRGGPDYRTGGAPGDANIAIVNTAMFGVGNSSWEKSVNHLLLWNITQIENNFYLVDDPQGTRPTVMRNVSLRKSILPRAHFAPSGGFQAEVIENNHFMNAVGVYGTETTSGGTLSMLFVDPMRGNFRPRSDGVLVGRSDQMLIPVDVSGTRRGYPADSIGAFENEEAEQNESSGG